MKKWMLGLAAMALAISAQGQVVINSLNTALTQNFDTVAAEVPSGWAFSETGANANSAFSTGSGSSNTGDTYFFGSSSNWSFGGLQSSNLIPTIGVAFTNNTGFTVTSLNISYIGETWRVGAASRSDRLDFQYSLNATSLTSGTWLNFDALDYSNPGQAATGSGSVQHSATISSSITSLSLANSSTIWLRWNSFDADGADDGMAINNFSLTAIPEPSTYALIGLGLAALIGLRRLQTKAPAQS